MTGGPGLLLARHYFREAVEPLLARWCGGVSYAAARVGAGSDVLGLDDAMSRDHDWGLRLQLFVADADVAAVSAALDAHLPETFRGHPTRFRFTGTAADRVGIDVGTVARFAHDRLGFDPSRGVTTPDWLSLSGQAVLEVVSGEVFADGPGELTRLREALAWYPDDVWRYVVACDWHRLDQELPLMGRAGDRGDELGSRVIAARLVDVVVHLAFLLSRAWPPYAKWRGTVLSRLPAGRAIRADLEAALAADGWVERTEALRRSMERLAEVQRDAGLPMCAPVVVPFWDRPYLHVEPALVPALLGSVQDAAVRGLPLGVGGIDQRTDNVDVLVHAERRRSAVGCRDD